MISATPGTPNGTHSHSEGSDQGPWTEGLLSWEEARLCGLAHQVSSELGDGAFCPFVAPLALLLPVGRHGLSLPVPYFSVRYSYGMRPIVNVI